MYFLRNYSRILFKDTCRNISTNSFRIQAIYSFFPPGILLGSISEIHLKILSAITIFGNRPSNFIIYQDILLRIPAGVSPEVSSSIPPVLSFFYGDFHWISSDNFNPWRNYFLQISSEIRPRICIDSSFQRVLRSSNVPAMFCWISWVFWDIAELFQGV